MSIDAPETMDERRALELLPWYVNGTLDGAEREEVGRALRSSLTCRLEHDRLVRLQRVMREHDAEDAATDRGFERLMTRIQQRRFWQRPALFSAAAALVAAVGLGVWWNRDDLYAGQIAGTTTRDAGAPEFATLTGTERAPTVRVVFAPGVAEPVRQELLAAYKLTIAAPPTPEGMYTLSVPAGADARAIADRLRADTKIVFASTPPANEAR